MFCQRLKLTVNVFLGGSLFFFFFHSENPAFWIYYLKLSSLKLRVQYEPYTSSRYKMIRSNDIGNHTDKSCVIYLSPFIRWILCFSNRWLQRTRERTRHASVSTKLNLYPNYWHDWTKPSGTDRNRHRYTNGLTARVRQKDAQLCPHKTVCFFSGRFAAEWIWTQQGSGAWRSDFYYYWV